MNAVAEDEIDMAWIDVIDEERAEGTLADVYEQIAGKRGRVSNIMRIHSLKPETMQTHMALYLSVMFKRSGLTRAERELVATAVSVANECPYCVEHHAEALRAFWKDDARVAAFVDGEDADLSPREDTLVRHARKLTLSPGDVAEADVDVLKESGFDDEEILSLTLVVGYFNFVNRMALGLGVEFTEEEVTGYNY